MFNSFKESFFNLFGIEIEPKLGPDWINDIENIKKRRLEEKKTRKNLKI